MESVEFVIVVVAMCSKLLELLFVDAHGWRLEESIGSGTIIDPDGTILTCAHVVADFQSTKAVVRGKVANLALTYLFISNCLLHADFVNFTFNH
jgi:hypothetical protein